MKQLIRVSVWLLFVMLSDFSSASSISYIKTFSGYKLQYSLGMLTNLETANQPVTHYLRSYQKDLNISAEDLQFKCGYFSCGYYYLIYEQFHSGIQVHQCREGWRKD